MKLMSYSLGLVLACVGILACTDRSPANERESVQDLMATYGWFVDRHDAKATVNLFEPDARLLASDSLLLAEGHQAIEGFYTTAWLTHHQDEQRRHLITGVRVHGKSGEGVAFSATFGVVGRNAEGLAMAYDSGTSQGIAVMTPEGYRFKELRISVD